jgi:hypothetical protein
VIKQSERNPHVLITTIEWSAPEWRAVHREDTLPRPIMLRVVQIKEDKINGSYA